MFDLRKDVEKILCDSNLVFDDTQLMKSIKFTEVLFDWHSKKNLISTQNPQHFLKSDFYDSIMLSKFLKGGVKNKLYDRKIKQKLAYISRIIERR